MNLTLLKIASTDDAQYSWVLINMLKNKHYMYITGSCVLPYIR